MSLNRLSKTARRNNFIVWSRTQALIQFLARRASRTYRFSQDEVEGELQLKAITATDRWINEDLEKKIPYLSYLKCILKLHIHSLYRSHVRLMHKHQCYSYSQESHTPPVETSFETLWGQVHGSLKKQMAKDCFAMMTCPTQKMKEMVKKHVTPDSKDPHSQKFHDKYYCKMLGVSRAYYYDDILPEIQRKTLKVLGKY